MSAIITITENITELQLIHEDNRVTTSYPSSINEAINIIESNDIDNVEYKFEDID